MQTKQLHVRLTGEEMDDLKALAEQCEVKATALAAFFLRAALRAAKAHGRRLKLPPNFEVADDVVVSRSANVRR